jgi:peroxidase
VQHITFNEFLPRVLGRDQLATFGLDLSPGYYEKYDPQCSVQTFNEFSSAAFR